MPLVPSTITSSIVQTAQSSQTAAAQRARRERQANSRVRLNDRVELSIEGVEMDNAVHKLQANDSERSHQERLGQQRDGEGPSLQRIDVQA